jgi:hypothetical protein
MSSSAITGNTSGIATATTPGLVGTGAQTFAGDKTFNGAITASNLTSGRYTPTNTTGTNVSALATYSCIYSRVGNIVTVSGKVDVTLTASGNSIFYLTLPIASPGLTVADVMGLCARSVSAGGAYTAGYVYGDATNKRALVEFYSTITGINGLFLNFQYEIK